ncbi:hypothetical protein AYL99_10322 [Fonsecaea erecta]|uniref:Uncharacterized protein n=1 Tax=Fonsecaea erecta TaxID=1367422 RepID=A0A178Z6F3_9EURO|nr:hypothetical protein AYL99_10322 [Fonsecaea erecta]OAP55349.1 hypothetical protein AYL99_10322 [Fonsecaea erecta]
MVIPLLAPSELDAHPAFARLWEHVTREVLAQDASSRREERDRERRWWASRRARRAAPRGSRRGEIDGEEELSFVDGRGQWAGGGGGGGGGDGAVWGYQELRRELEPDEEGDDDDDDEYEDADVTEDDAGKQEERPSPRLSLSLDQHLHALRVARTKRRILRDVLDHVAYLDLSVTGQSHARGQDDDEGHPEASESYHPYGAEIRSRSQSQNGLLSPASTYTTAPVEMAGGTKTGMSDVTNQGLDVQAQVARREGHGTRGKTDNVSRDRLPPSLGELVRVIAAYLHGKTDGAGALSSAVTQEEEGLLDQDILRFKMNISPIADVVSSRLVELESSLCALSDIAREHGDGNGSEDEDETKVPGTMGHTSVTQGLDESVQAQLSRLSELRDTLLPSSLAALSTTLQQLLTLQRQLLQLQIQHLETSKHGVLSRYTLSKIAFLDTVAQAMALKAQVLVLEARKELELSPQAQKRREAMREKMAVVAKEEAQLDDRIRLLEGVLAEYDEAGEHGAGIMSKLGRRYKEIEEETEAVRRDIEMLQRRASKR